MGVTATKEEKEWSVKSCDMVCDCPDRRPWLINLVVKIGYRLQVHPVLVLGLMCGVLLFIILHFSIN